MLRFQVICPCGHRVNLFKKFSMRFASILNCLVLTILLQLDKNLNSLVDSLLGLIDRREVLQFVHQSASYFGLLRGYSNTCPHALVHLSNLRATCRLLNLLVQHIDNQPTVSPNMSFKSGFTFPTWVRTIHVFGS